MSDSARPHELPVELTNRSTASRSARERSGSPGTPSAARCGASTRHRAESPRDPAAVRARRDRGRRGSRVGDVPARRHRLAHRPRRRTGSRQRSGSGAESTAIAAGDGAVWVANSFDGTVSRIDPRTNTVVATIPRRLDAGARSPPAPEGSGSQPPTSPDRIADECDQDRRALGLQGLIPICVQRHARRAAELPLLERGGKRAGSATDGRSRRRLDRRPPGPARLRLCRRDDSLRARRGATPGRAGRRRHPDRPADGRRGTCAPGLREAPPAHRIRQRHVIGAAAPPSAELLQLPHRRRAVDGRAWRVRVPHARLAHGRHRGDRQDDVFDWAQAAGFVAEFCSLGGTIMKRIWVPPDTQDFSTLSQPVPASGVDGFFFATYATSATRVREGLPGAPWQHLEGRRSPGHSRPGRPAEARRSGSRHCRGGPSDARRCEAYMRRFP